ncbi:MAG: hypothetical protein IJZ83_00975 [Clostridia bacterium]|nr:hypothetical protein [Clostridia bacterium]
MKKRNTKNFLTRLTAFIVMALMLVPIIPLTAYAEPAGYQDGDLLLKMDALDGTATYNPYGVELGTSTAKNAKLDEDDKTKILTTSGSPSAGGVGITTNLPFGSSTKYTIEYYAKLTEYSKNYGVFFGFCQDTNEAYKGANMLTYATLNKVNTYSKWWVNGYYKEDSSDRYGRGIGCNPWTVRADADGFVRFVLTFDGQYMSLSIGGIAVDVRYDLENPETTNFTSISNWPNKNLCLSAGFTNKDQGTAKTVEQDYCVVEIKNISVYAGVRTAVEVRDEDGNVLKKVETFDEEGIAATAFNQVEGDQVIWCDPYTGAVVEAPSGTYTSDTVFIAKSRDRKASDVIGVQLGEVGDDGKRNIRIVGGMYNTEGTSVGFDVLIEYMKDGELKQDKYRITSTSVYESINANVDGDITNHTAKDLGANYLIVLAVEGVDTTNYSQIDFKVASFRTFDGNDARVYSEIFEFSIVDGKFTTTADRLA